MDRGTPLALLAQAREVLHAADQADDLGERFRLAHLAALRTAAAVVGSRTPGGPGGPGGRRRLESLWVVLRRVAPDLADWADCFAASAPLRAAVEAGARTAVTPRRADDELRAATQFLALAENSLGLLAA